VVPTLLGTALFLRAPTLIAYFQRLSQQQLVTCPSQREVRERGEGIGS
jgi:hypothetical protein